MKNMLNMLKENKSNRLEYWCCKCGCEMELQKEPWYRWTCIYCGNTELYDINKSIKQLPHELEDYNMFD